MTTQNQGSEFRAPGSGLNQDQSKSAGVPISGMGGVSAVSIVASQLDELNARFGPERGRQIARAISPVMAGAARIIMDFDIGHRREQIEVLECVAKFIGQFAVGLREMELADQQAQKRETN
jgi:hypothetical protein